MSITVSLVLFQLLWVLEHLQAVTTQPPETRNERDFQADHGDHIKIAIQKLQNPGNYKNPHSVWEPFKQVSNYCGRMLYNIHVHVQ